MGVKEAQHGHTAIHRAISEIDVLCINQFDRIVPLLFAVRITRTETFSFKMSSQSFRIQLSGQIAKIVVLLHLIIIPWLVDPMLSRLY